MSDEPENYGPALPDSNSVLEEGDTIRIVERREKGMDHGFWYKWVPAGDEKLGFSNQIPENAHECVKPGSLVKVTKVRNGLPADLEVIERSA